MSARILIGLLLLASTAVADPKVVVELVPDNPGPYKGGESLTLDVWLQSQVLFDVRLSYLQLDFSQTDPRISLDPTFTFDFSSAPKPYATDLQLPVPWAWNGIKCVCPDSFLLLPGSGSLHIGGVGLQLPIEPGAYRLDVLNADEPDKALGARLVCHLGCSDWRAFTGEIIGGGL